MYCLTTAFLCRRNFRTHLAGCGSHTDEFTSLSAVHERLSEVYPGYYIRYQTIVRFDAFNLAPVMAP